MVLPASSSSPPIWLTLNGEPLQFEGLPGETAARDLENLAANAGEGGNLLVWQAAAPRHLEVRENNEVIAERNGQARWTPRGFSGLYTLEAYDPDSRITRKARVRVLPNLISYQHYQVMLNEIQQIAYHLIFRTESPAAEAVGLADQQPTFTVGLVEFAKLSRLLRDVDAILAAILRNPHYSLSEQQETVPLGYAQNIVPDSLADGIPSANGFPETVRSARSQHSYDTFENRVLKQFVAELVPVKLIQIIRQLDNELALRKQDHARAIKRMTSDNNFESKANWQRTADREQEQINTLVRIRAQCLDLQKLAESWSRLPFLQQVGRLSTAPNPTQVLMKEPNYRNFYQIYQAFQSDLRLVDFSKYFATLSIRLQSELYELWAVFTATAILRDLLLAQGFVQRSTEKFYKIKGDTFQIEVDRRAMVEFAKGDIRIRAAYERDYLSFQEPGRLPDPFGSTGRGNKTPDLAIEILKSNQPLGIVILDAKYKQDNGAALASDIIKLEERYVNWLGFRRHPSERVQSVESVAYVLYPGSVLDYDPDMSSGAIPLTPSQENEQHNQLKRVLSELLSSFKAF